MPVSEGSAAANGIGRAQRESKEARRARKAARAQEREQDASPALDQPQLDSTSRSPIAGEDAKQMPRLNPECDTGPIEHKWRLKRPPPIRFQQLVIALPNRSTSLF